MPQAANDASDLRDALVNSLGWNFDNIRVLTGAVTLDQVRQAFDSLSEMLGEERDALFLFYVSTHGDILFDGRGQPEPFLLCEDTNPSKFYEGMNSGMPRNFIGTMLRGLPAREVILISDACHAMLPTDPDCFTPQSFYKNFDVHVIGASTSEALIMKGARNSLFTSRLLKVIGDSNGELTSQVLFSDAAKLLPAGAPQPFNNSKGGVINLGQQRSPVTLDTFLENCRKQLAAISAGRYSNSGYVTRAFAERHFEAFLASPYRWFTVVGSAGSGKSTLGLHLAATSLAAGHPVIWIDAKSLGVRRSASEIVGDETRALGVSPAELDLFLKQKPLVLFLDGINETGGTADWIKSLCAGLSKMAEDGTIRLVASCREVAWHELGAPFEGRTYLADPAGERSAISIALSGYDEAEWEQARRVYSIPDAIAGIPLLREPIFLNMMAQLSKAGVAFKDANLLTVFRDYFEFKVSRIATRLGRMPREIEQSIDGIIAAMPSESIPLAEFQSLAQPAIAYSLLDEGLFRQAENQISVEVELTHEYLLSRRLPADLFDSPYPVSVYDRLWWGAASFRLLQIQDSDHVLRILNSFADPSQLVAMVSKLPSHPSYAGLRSDFYPVLLRRVHGWFHDIGYYDWEPKRWSDIDYSEFRRRLRTHLLAMEAAAPQLLALVFDQYPELAFEHLLGQWLGDRTPLKGTSNSACIADVAAIFLRQYAMQYPDLCLQAIDEWLSNVPDPRGVQRADLQEILIAATERSPAGAVSCMLRWLPAGRIQIVSHFIGYLPPEKEPEVIEAIRLAVLDRRAAPAPLRAQLLAAAGSLGTFGVLKLAVELLEDRSMADGAIRSLEAIARRLPEQADAAIEQYLPREVANPHFSSLIHYGEARIDSNPRLSISIFERVLTATKGVFNVKISQACTGTARFGAEVRGFVEQRLISENEGLALEYYGRSARKYRRIGSGDLAWIHRWILTGAGAYGLLQLLVESDIPLNDQMTIYLRAAEVTVDFIGNSINSYTSEEFEGLMVLRAYAQSVRVHPDFVKLPSSTQDWFTAVAAGESPVSAYRDLYMR